MSFLFSCMSGKTPSDNRTNPMQQTLKKEIDQESEMGQSVASNINGFHRQTTRNNNGPYDNAEVATRNPHEDEIENSGDQ